MNNLEQILCEVFRLKETELNDSLTKEDIEQWDSLTHMDLITSLEEGLNIQFTMDDIMEMQDIKTIKEIVSKKLG